MPGRSLDIVGQDSSDFRHLPILLYSFEVYFIYSSRMMGNSLESLQLQSVISQTQLDHL